MPEPYPSELLDAISALLGRRDLTQQEVQAWWNGTVDGGPNNDGLYPFTDSTGYVSYQPCPALVAAGGGGGSADYPSFVDNAGKFLRVNLAENGVEWVDAGGAGLPTGGTPGQALINTAPGTGSWADLPVGSGTTDVLDVGTVGIPTNGTTPIAAGQFETVVEAQRTAILNNVGKQLQGLGVGLLSTSSQVIDGVTKPSALNTINLRNANADLRRLRFQAPAGANGGYMLKLGRNAITGDGPNANVALGIPSRTTITAWGGDRTAGINRNIDGVLLDNDTATGAQYDVNVSYVRNALTISGNVEKKVITLSAAYIDCAAKVIHTANGSPDSVGVDLSIINYNGKLIDSSYGTYGNDTSITWFGFVEGFRGIPGDTGYVVRDENGKVSTYDITIRGYDGQGAASAYYYFNQPPGENDYADTVTWGGRNRHHTMNGQTLKAESVQSMGGTFNLFNANDAYTSVTNDANANGVGPRVPTPAMFVGRMVHAGEFHVNASKLFNLGGGLVHGSDEYFAIGTDYGTAAITMGYFKPYAGGYGGVGTGVAARIHKGDRSSYPFSQLHGAWQIGAQVLDCSVRIPATNIILGYAGTIETGAVATLHFPGRLTFGQAVAANWLPQVVGETVAVFESVADYDGLAITQSRGRFHLSGNHRVSQFALQSQASDINKYFKVDGLVAGARGIGTAFVSTGDGPTDAWINQRTDAVVTPVETPQLTSFLAQSSTTPSANWRAIYDRLLYRLQDGGYLAAGVMSHVLGMEHEDRSLRSIFPAPSGTWHDATKVGTLAWTKGRGHFFRPTSFRVLLLASAGDTITVNGTVFTFVTGVPNNNGEIQIGFASTISDPFTGLPKDITAVERTAYNMQARFDGMLGALGLVGAAWSTNTLTFQSTTVTMQGQSIVLAASNPGSIAVQQPAYLSTSYNFGANAEGLTRDDMLLLVATSRRDDMIPGSPNGSDLGSRNGYARLRARDGAQTGGIGTLTTSDFPLSADRLPSIKMFGRVSPTHQFAVERGRVVTPEAVASTNNPDIFDIGRSYGSISNREIWATGLFKASTVAASRDGYLGLYRAYEEAFLAAKALA